MVSAYPVQAHESFPAKYVLKTWDTDAGSPFLAVTAIAQTPDGYLWLGSYEGLARFDGVRFEHEAQAVFPVKGLLVLSLAVDHDGSLWAGTSDGIWRRKNQEWVKFKPAEGLVYSVAVGAKGQLAAIVGGEVVQWNGAGFDILPKVSTRLNRLSQTICYFDNEDRLWISGRRFIHSFQDGEWQTLFNFEDPANPARLLGSGPARDGGIWVAGTDSLERYQDAQVVETVARIEGHRGDEVSLWEDEAGNLWEAGERHGLVVHQPDGTHIHCTIDDGLSHNTLLSISPDREGNVWLGTDGGGLNRVRPRSIFSHADRRQLPQPVINTVRDLGDGRLLVGTHGGGAMFFADGRFSSPLTTEHARLPLGDQSWVQTADIEADGTLWLGTFQTGLYRVRDSSTKTWRNDDLGGSHIYGLHRDDRGVLWVGTERSVTLIRGDQAEIQAQGEIPWGVVNMIESDKSGHVWITNRDGKLWRHTGSGYEEVERVGSNAVKAARYLHRDETRALWITTAAGTLLREFDMRWAHYGREHGLPLGEWKPLTLDDEGYRWFGSNRGLMRVTESSLDAVARHGSGELETQVFNQVDGMSSPRVRNQFQQIGTRTADGRIWVATIKGLVEVDPSRILKPKQSPRVHIEQVRVGARSLKAIITRNDEVTIPPGSERVNIRYTGTSASYGESLTYEYFLEGVDADWVPAGDEPIARITDLSPGSYVFRVRVIGLEGKPLDEARISLQVEPFWWQRWDVRLLGVMLFVIAIAGIVTGTTRVRYRRQRVQDRALTAARVRAERIKHEMDLANAANEAKSEFLANMSHEIRTPLNGVIGSMDLMMDTPMSREQREHMKTLAASAETLLAVLNDILDFSKIEAGKISIENAPFDLAELLRGVVEVVVPRARSQGIELALVLPPDVPATLGGDATRIRQVLINLIGNAVKFTEKGYVAVSVAVRPRGEDDAPGDARLRFSVKDTGLGISPEKQALLFDRFTQADASTTRKYGGSGLGLAICKRLVELMGGNLHVSSKLGQGAEFFFDLVLPATDEHAPKPIPVSGPVVLLDESAIGREAAGAFLSRHGIQFRATAKPATAIEWLRNAAAGDAAPSAHLLIAESSADLLDAGQIRDLREMTEARSPLGIVLMSVRPSQRPQVPPFPIRATLRKPMLDPELLRECLVPSVEEDSSGPAEEAGAPVDDTPTGFSAHVLLADDEPVNRAVLGRLLKRLGCTLDFAENGQQAVEMAAEQPYALIFMDCRMPVLDGYAAASKIRETLPDAPPIIAITANTTVEDRDHCLEVGMVDFVSKPARRSELARVLRKWVPMHTA